jgi:hypothetical protein
MGDRSQIIVKVLDQPDIHIYGHWAGTDNVQAVKNVLAQPDNRVGDATYFTAKLFHEFAVVLGKYDGGLGYGVGTGDIFCDNPDIIVDAETGQWEVE